MRGIVVALVVATIACVGCAPSVEGGSSSPDVASSSAQSVDPSPSLRGSATPALELDPDSVFGPEERETYEALAPFEDIELAMPDGTPVTVNVPSIAVCEDAQCAVYAAIHYLAMQDDVISGHAVDSWLALSSPDCYFCMDTVAVRDELVAAGVTVEGGYVTLNDYPTVFTEDYIFEMMPFNEFDLPSPDLVPLSLSTDQAEITYNDHGKISTRESAWVTFLMVMKWDGTYWRVEAAALT